MPARANWGAPTHRYYGSPVVQSAHTFLARYRPKADASIESTLPSWPLLRGDGRPGDRAITQPNVSDAAVQAKTGRVWAEWFALLDDEGAARLPHPEIAILLRERHGLSGWWSQTVTVAYEQARGLRVLHQTARGFQVGVSRTVPVNVDVLFTAWVDEASRQRWLGDEAITIRRATRPKSMRITWSDGHTNVDVNFWNKGPAKSSVQIQHSKLADRNDVEAKRTFWRAALGRLAEQVTA